MLGLQRVACVLYMRWHNTVGFAAQASLISCRSVTAAVKAVSFKARTATIRINAVEGGRGG